MNRQEAVKLARYVRALCPQQKFDEYTADVWGDVLAGYDFEACMQAVVALGQRQPFIAPAEIIAEVRKGRDAALQAFEYEPGDPDESTADYLQRRRHQLAAVATGQRPATLPALPPGERPEFPTVGRAIPAAGQARPTSALGVPCPACHAPAGSSCRTTKLRRRMADPHPSRTDAYRSLP